MERRRRSKLEEEEEEKKGQEVNGAERFTNDFR